MATDKELLKIYMVGFNDELARDYLTNHKTYNVPIEHNAYIIGRADAIIGDDVSSSDEQSDEEILERIKKLDK
jgi:hypothetical protein